MGFVLQWVVGLRLLQLAPSIVATMGAWTPLALAVGRALIGGTGLCFGGQNPIRHGSLKVKEHAPARKKKQEENIQRENQMRVCTARLPVSCCYGSWGDHAGRKTLEARRADAGSFAVSWAR